MQACPFPFTWFPVVWEISLPGWSPSSAQDHGAKPDQPGCLLPFMKIWFRINETQHAALFPNAFVMQIAHCLLMEQCKLLAGRSRSLVSLPCGCARASVHRREEPVFGEPTVAWQWYCRHPTGSVGSKDPIFQRMLREMKTFCSAFSLLKVYWESWRVQWYLLQ